MGEKYFFFSLFLNSIRIFRFSSIDSGDFPVCDWGAFMSQVMYYIHRVFQNYRQHALQL